MINDKGIAQSLFGRNSEEARAQLRGALEEDLTEILRRLCALRDNRFQNKERYARFEAGLSACMAAYEAYLCESGRYQRAKIVQESYCAPGGIEYRISLLNDYVQEDLDSEDEIRYVMTRGYFECIRPILDRTDAMRKRLSEGEETAPPKKPDRDELLRRYFRGKTLYRLVELEDAAAQCQKDLREGPGTLEKLEAVQRQAAGLKAGEADLRRQCRNGSCDGFIREMDAVTEELKAHSRELALELEHYERLAACIEKCVSGLDRDSLFVGKDDTGGYSEDADRLAELKEAYVQAMRRLEEVTEIGRYRAAE